MMKYCADSILDDLLESLREDRVRAAIEIPIDRSAECYNFPAQPPLTYHQQLHQLADFVRHIYANGLTLPRILSPEQACAETIDLLERGYQGSVSNGFAAAMEDARNEGRRGFEFLASQIAELIKVNRKDRYIRWIFAKHLDPCDWRTKRELVEILLRRLKQVIPMRLKDRSPAQFVEFIPSLIQLHLQTSRLLDQVYSKK